jgi:hypothetical protein
MTLLRASAAALAIVGAMSVATPARADWRYRHWNPHHWYRHHGYGHHWYGHHWYGHRWYGPRWGWAPGYYYRPPPVYYAPPPGYYSPGMSFGVIIR